MARISQLRIYTINKGKMDEFVAAWRSQVVALRRKQGFIVEGGWIFTEVNKFVWLLSLDGTPEEWEAKNQFYYASPERLNMQPNPSDFIAHMDVQMIQSVLED